MEDFLFTDSLLVSTEVVVFLAATFVAVDWVAADRCFELGLVAIWVVFGTAVVGCKLLLAVFWTVTVDFFIIVAMTVFVVVLLLLLSDWDGDGDEDEEDDGDEDECLVSTRTTSSDAGAG